MKTEAEIIAELAEGHVPVEIIRVVLEKVHAATGLATGDGRVDSEEGGSPVAS